MDFALLGFMEKSKIKFIIFLLQIFVAHSLKGTQFREMSVKERVLEANAAVEAIYSGSISYQNSSGQIMTQHQFKKLRSNMVGDEPTLLLSILGGVFQGEVMSIDGAPDFKVGSRYLLLLNIRDRHIYLSNFTMGVWDFIATSEGEFYRPQVRVLGLVDQKISRSKILEIIEDSWKTNFKDVEKVVKIDHEDLLFPEYKTSGSRKRNMNQEFLSDNEKNAMRDSERSLASLNQNFSNGVSLGIREIVLMITIAVFIIYKFKFK